MFQQKVNLVLVVCPREKMVTVYQKPEQTPELIVIDQLSDRYGPVYFSHKFMLKCLKWVVDVKIVIITIHQDRY